MLRIITTALLFLALGQAQTTYTVTTFAGNNTQGFSGDGGPATSAELNQSFSSTYSGGLLYISDSGNQCIRLVDPVKGTITTTAGTCATGSYAGDGGTATAAYLLSPSGAALDSSGNLYIADTGNNIIRKVTSGKISLLAGDPNNSNFADGAALSAANFRSPAGIAVDSAGNLYIADSGNNAIRKYTAATATVSTLAGTGLLNAGYSGDGGPAIKATLKAPSAVLLDTQGNLYIADTGNHAIRKISGGIITTVAGTVGPGSFSGDGGKATVAHLNNPKGIALDGAGNLYIADTVNNRIRVVSSGGIINTIAGTGKTGYAGDQGPATAAVFYQPAGVALNGAGNIYVSDTGNSVIRLLTPSNQGGTGAPPSIFTGGVVTASNFGAFTAIAPGTWIEIYGTNLAANTGQWSGADFNPNAPTSLNRTNVTIANQAAFIEYVSTGQVNAQVPNIAIGPQLLTVTNAVGTSASYPLLVNPTQPGLYAPPNFLLSGKQYVGAVINDPTTTAQTFALPANSVSGFTSRPAKAGETLTIYGVGFGPVNTNTQPGQVAPGNSTLSGGIQILFGGTPAVLSYYGLSPQAVGLYQFNVVVPTIPSNNAVPLTFTLNGAPGTQTLYTAVQ